MIHKKNESVYPKYKIKNNNTKKNRYDLITKLFVNLDFGGFLKYTKKTIILQNIISITQPVINA